MASTSPSPPTSNPTRPGARPEPGRRDGFLDIGDYAAIGDGRTLALVGRDGSIDWMCLPDLDSPATFAALLSPREGGSFSLAPDAPYRVKRRYVERSNVLETVFETDAGAVRVIDALTTDPTVPMPWRELVRQVEGVSGTVAMRWRWDPRPQFGRAEVEWGTHQEAAVGRCGELSLALRAWEAGADDTGRAGRFEISAGARSLLVMTAAAGKPLPLPGRDEVERRLGDTVGLWQRWVGRQTYEGTYRAAVERSLLALGLLADRRSGAMVAAGTTSLPEVLGGKRNYDYRLGWVRDAAFSLDALMSTGMQELTHQVVSWLLGAVGATRPRVNPVYALDGSAVRSQHSLPVPGYRLTRPVHIGNQAGSQLQLGGWGDLLETICIYVGRGHVLDRESGERLGDALDLLARIWRQEDSGLWEISPAAYGTSKVSVWTAFDRGIDLAAAGQLPTRHVDHWRRERDAVREYIEAHLWSPERGSYLQKAGSDALDCGMLLLSRRRYADPAGEQMRHTIDAIRGELTAEGPLLYRYSGMGDEENAFIACSFWMVEALALAGRRDEAVAMMDELVDIGNDVGLLSEEIVPGERALRGNLPQALSHLSLINAAVALGSGD
jgi:GH15 family glucan-1,4-alpha-glucosidase